MWLPLTWHWVVLEGRVFMKRLSIKILSGILGICLFIGTGVVNVHADTFLCAESKDVASVVLENVSEGSDVYNFDEKVSESNDYTMTDGNENKETDTKTATVYERNEDTQEISTELESDCLNASDILNGEEIAIDGFDVIKDNDVVYVNYVNPEYVNDVDSDVGDIRLLDDFCIATDSFEVKNYTELVECVTNAMVNRSTEFSAVFPVSIVGNVTMSDFAVKLINDAFYDDGVTTNPKGGDYLLLNLSNWKMLCVCSNNEYRIKFTINYLTTASQEAMVDRVIKELMEHEAYDKMSDYDKALKIHDYVCSLVEYKNENSLSHSAYSALCNKKAVCQGYASLYYRLCREAGLPCRCATGSVDNEAHAWNFVRIENKWYFVDTTFDDGLRSDDYFLKPESSVRSHVRTNLKNFFDKTTNVLATTSYVATPLISVGKTPQVIKASEMVYNIAFDKNGSSAVANTPAISRIKFDTEVKLYDISAISRPGYTFKEWNTKSDGTGKGYAAGTLVKKLASINNETITLYAIWNPIAYKVNYVLNGGVNSTKNPTTHTVAKSVSLRKPTREGYKFVGWYVNPKFSGKRYTSIIKSTSDITFYAKWKPIVYTIKFNGNSIKAGGVTDRTRTMAKLEYDKTYTLKENRYVSKAGKKFLGWNTRADGKGTSYSNMAQVKNLMSKNKKSITLFAQWGN